MATLETELRFTGESLRLRDEFRNVLSEKMRTLASKKAQRENRRLVTKEYMIAVMEQALTETFEQFHLTVPRGDYPRKEN